MKNKKIIKLSACYIVLLLLLSNFLLFSCNIDNNSNKYITEKYVTKLFHKKQTFSVFSIFSEEKNGNFIYLSMNKKKLANPDSLVKNDIENTLNNYAESKRNGTKVYNKSPLTNFYYNIKNFIYYSTIYAELSEDGFNLKFIQPYNVDGKIKFKLYSYKTINKELLDNIKNLNDKQIITFLTKYGEQSIKDDATNEFKNLSLQTVKNIKVRRFIESLLPLYYYFNIENIDKYNKDVKLIHKNSKNVLEIVDKEYKYKESISILKHYEILELEFFQENKTELKDLELVSKGKFRIR